MRDHGIFSSEKNMGDNESVVKVKKDQGAV